MSDPSLRIVLERDELHLAQDLARRDGVRVEPRKISRGATEFASRSSPSRTSSSR